ncbi:MAG: YhcH/YjgK/YiaL family protein [Prevotella sp.]|nr:YhcH/YjgK/YiaL family protein [Prevotella sp.]
MKKISLLLILFLAVIALHAQGYYTQYYHNPSLLTKAEEWMKSGEWRCGFTAADPHPSVNTIEFYEQYQKNPEQWKALFSWLAHTDLLTLPKGKHPIEGSNLVVSVEDDVNRPLEKRKSESHHHHIDFQYVVRGTERFGIIDHYTSTPNCRYKPDVIHYDYQVEKTRFMDSNPRQFFIFFPGDWHIAKIKNDTDDQQIRVIVVKVDYK